MALITYGDLRGDLGLALAVFVAPWLSDPSEERRQYLTPIHVTPIKVVKFLIVIVALVALVVGVPFACRLFGLDIKSYEMSGRTRIVIVGITWMVSAIAQWHKQRTKSLAAVKPA